MIGNTKVEHPLQVTVQPVLEKFQKNFSPEMEATLKTDPECSCAYSHKDIIKNPNPISALPAVLALI